MCSLLATTKATARPAPFPPAATLKPFSLYCNHSSKAAGDVTPRHIFRVKRITHRLQKPNDPTKLTLDVYYPNFRSQQMTIRERICTAIYSLYISTRNIPTPKHKTIASLGRLLYSRRARKAEAFGMDWSPRVYLCGRWSLCVYVCVLAVR